MKTRSLHLAAVLCSFCLWTASCSDDGGNPAPDAATPDALGPDAAAPPDAAADAAVAPECRLPDDCTDGVFCNGEETCAGGNCEPASKSPCDDSIACTVDTCDEDGERCRSTADDGLCSNGRFCDGFETCAAAGCENGPPPVTAGGVLCRNGRITAGFAHTCALLNSGPVYCWGRADLGQTGHGNKTDVGDNEPASAGGALRFGGQTVVDIDAGDNHTCALLADGTVRCWGRNTNGQLGYGNTTAIGDTEAPSTVGPVDAGGTVTQIAAGGNHTCALLADGTVRCWGQGTLGRLGYGNTASIGDNEAPAAAGAVNVGGTVIQVAAGASHTCAVLDTGAVRCWGFAFFGQLGYGNTLDIGGRSDRLPATAGDVPVGSSVAELTLGESHTCARLETSAVRCWGRGDKGQLGNASTDNLGDNEVLLLDDIGLDSAAVHLVAGAEHNCALLENGDVSCWGNAGLGRLGHGDLANIGDDEAPTAAGGVPLP